MIIGANVEGVKSSSVDARFFLKQRFRGIYEGWEIPEEDRMTKGMELIRGQRGMGTIQVLLATVLIAVAGFGLMKIGGAFLDISGFRKDLEENIAEMRYTCLSTDCEEEFLDEIEQLRVLKGRDLEIDWENIDWLGADNELVVKGWKVVDFRVWKYYYYFNFEVPVHN